MSTAFISEWASFTDTRVDVTGAAPIAYGGVTDWLGYWLANENGGADLTEVFLKFRTAPGKNYTTEVAVLTANDLPLLQQDNAAAQLPGALLYPGTDRDKSVDAPPTITWNGYAWVSTTSGYSSSPTALFGGDAPAS